MELNFDSIIQSNNEFKQLINIICSDLEGNNIKIPNLYLNNFDEGYLNKILTF